MTWYRIELLLPVNDFPERMAVGRIINTLRQVVDGLTATPYGEYSYHGYYKDSNGKWIMDMISVLYIDIDVPQRFAVRAATTLGNMAGSKYAQVGRRQEAMWVTVTPLVNNPRIV